MYFAFISRLVRWLSAALSGGLRLLPAVRARATSPALSSQQQQRQERHPFSLASNPQGQPHHLDLDASSPEQSPHQPHRHDGHHDTDSDKENCGSLPSPSLPPPPTPPPDRTVNLPSPPPPTTLPTMAERQLTQILTQLKSQSSTLSYADASALLSKAKLLLLKLEALTPATSSSPSLLALARETYEQGALASIRAKNPDLFTRYVSQLAAFYELPASVLPPNPTERSKVTGLYLLLLLTQGRYAEFHSELEALSTTGAGTGAVDIEGDRYLGYPIRLERWLMEGSYDRVWKAMKKGEVPCEEYSVFSDILTFQIRSEIASSSERAYPSLPLSSTKSLLFLESEGAVVDFARSRGWIIRDGNIYFPSANAAQEAGEEAEQEKETSQMIIENTLGYARQLETIV